MCARCVLSGSLGCLILITMTIEKCCRYKLTSKMKIQSAFVGKGKETCVFSSRGVICMWQQWGGGGLLAGVICIKKMHSM